jgi:hypothetical protein
MTPRPLVGLAVPKRGDLVHLIGQVYERSNLGKASERLRRKTLGGPLTRQGIALVPELSDHGL